MTSRELKEKNRLIRNLYNAQHRQDNDRNIILQEAEIDSSFDNKKYSRIERDTSNDFIPKYDINMKIITKENNK